MSKELPIYVNSIRLQQAAMPHYALSLEESVVEQTLEAMQRIRGLILAGKTSPVVLQALNLIRQGSFIDRSLALELASTEKWLLIALAWIVNQEFGPQNSGAHMCTGSYGLNEKCPQGCSMCSFSGRSDELMMLTQPDFQQTPEQFVTEAERQVALVRKYNPGAKIAFKVTHIGLGLKGNAKLQDTYVEILKAVNKVEGVDFVDACLGLLDEQAAAAIAPWVYKYNCNLERIQRPGEEWVTDRHTLQNKIDTLRIAKRAGMGVCSGVLVGAGETIQDKIDILLLLRELVDEGVINSSPLNAFTAVYPSDEELISRIPEDDCILALCLARILLPVHPFFPNAGRHRFGKYLPAMHAIASGFSSWGNYLTKFVDPATDQYILSVLKNL